MIKNTYDLKARCSSCSRFLKIKAGASSDVVVVCPDRKCKAENSIKVVMITDYLPHDHPDKPENKAKKKPTGKKKA